MSMFSIFNISGSAVSAQSQRLNVVASNLANVDAVAGPDGSVYKARQVVFQTVPMGNDGSAGVKVNAISEDNTPGRRIHDPSNPLADGEGYVYSPDVDPVAQMVNLISTSRNYQAGVEMLNTAKELTLATLTMGR